MAKSKETKRREASIRNLVNHFSLISRLISILPGGKNFQMYDYKHQTGFVINNLYREVTSIQSSCQALHCTMSGCIDTPDKMNYVQDPAMVTLIGWSPENVVNWLFDGNLPGFVKTVNDEIGIYSGSYEQISFDQQIYDAVFRQVKFYVQSHTQ